MRSGGQLLVDQLIKQGVKDAFCVPGESYLAVLDALYLKRKQISLYVCLLYTSPSPRDRTRSRMPSSA